MHRYLEGGSPPRALIPTRARSRSFRARRGRAGGLSTRACTGDTVQRARSTGAPRDDRGTQPRAHPPRRPCLLIRDSRDRSDTGLRCVV